jgi:hypothetical protein
LATATGQLIDSQYIKMMAAQYWVALFFMLYDYVLLTGSKTCIMKKNVLFAISFVMLLLVTGTANAQLINGAWKLVDNTAVTEKTCIIEDNYFMQADYDKATKKFTGTMGGTCLINGDGKLNVTIEFNTIDSNEVGSSFSVNYKIENGNLLIDVNGQNSTWQRIDDGKGPLAGNWRITEREQDGKMNPMRPGPRKTLKILSGTRFQWAAINPQTKEFFGTGGGTYTFTNGKYTETIEFFSRDSSRVGISLSFDGSVEGKRWHHSGKSSKGDRISEIWTRQL